MDAQFIETEVIAQMQYPRRASNPPSLHKSVSACSPYMFEASRSDLAIITNTSGGVDHPWKTMSSSLAPVL